MKTWFAVVLWVFLVLACICRVWAFVCKWKMNHKKKEEDVEAARKRLKCAVLVAHILLCAFILICSVFVAVKYRSPYLIAMCISFLLPVLFAVVWAIWRE